MHPAIGGVAAARFRAGGAYCRADVLRGLPRDPCGTGVAAGNGADGKYGDHDDDDDQRATGDPPADGRLLLLNLLIVRVGGAVPLAVRRLTRLAVSPAVLSDRMQPVRFGRTRLGQSGRPAPAYQLLPGPGLAEVRLDWARLPRTKPCHPSTERALAPRLDRGTIQPSHSRPESMLRPAEGDPHKASRYLMHSVRRFARARACAGELLSSSLAGTSASCEQLSAQLWPCLLDRPDSSGAALPDARERCYRSASEPENAQLQPKRPVM